MCDLIEEEDREKKGRSHGFEDDNDSFALAEDAQASRTFHEEECFTSCAAVRGLRNDGRLLLCGRHLRQATRGIQEEEEEEEEDQVVSRFFFFGFFPSLTSFNSLCFFFVLRLLLKFIEDEGVTSCVVDEKTVNAAAKKLIEQTKVSTSNFSLEKYLLYSLTFKPVLFRISCSERVFCFLFPKFGRNFLFFYFNLIFFFSWTGG